MGPMCCPEMSVTNYRSKLGNIPEEWRSNYTATEAWNHEFFPTPVLYEAPNESRESEGPFDDLNVEMCADATELAGSCLDR